MKIIESICKILFEIIEGIFNFIFEGIENIFKYNRQEEYTAEFASQGSVVSSFNKGFCLTGTKNLTLSDSFKNALIIGGTGVGKSSIILIPSILTMRSSFIIHDPASEVYPKVSGFLKSIGYDVIVLNFANPSVSCGYNPLHRVKNNSDIQKIASMLVKNTLGEGGKDSFWNLQAVNLLAMLITVLRKQDEEQYKNLWL